MRKNIDLYQFLIGSKLGDASFVKKSENHNTYIVFKHCEEQYEYLNWKYNVLNSHGFIREGGNGITKVNIKEGSCFKNYQNQYKFATVSSRLFNKYKNISDDDIVNEFGEQAFAIWILDDGNLNNRTTKIACGVLSEQLCLRLIDVIKKDMDIDAYYYKHPSNKAKNYIRIPARHYEKVKAIVLKYIPDSIDIVRDKFNTEPQHGLEVKVKYFSEQPKLCYVENKSDWIDLRSAETVEMKAGEFKLIPLGVGMILPEGYEAHVVPRSSTFKNFGIIQTNHMGVIDESYCGDNDQWRFPAYALRDTVINKNDRICQFRIAKKQPEFELNEVDHLKDTDRGGFGSTGTT